MPSHSRHGISGVKTWISTLGLCISHESVNHGNVGPVTIWDLCKLKSKGKFLYSAVSSPQDCSKHFILYFPDSPVQSNTVSTSLGNIQPHATINVR